MSKITFIQDNLSPDEWVSVETDSPTKTLMGVYGSFPQYARLYAGDVISENEVTPKTPDDIDKLEALNDDIFVVHNIAQDTIESALKLPFLPIKWLIDQYVKSKVPDESIINKSSTRSISPNNELGARSNKGRPLGRIPDIYGRVKAVPDLLTNPYTTYEDNIEFEHSFMCVGRGYYNIEAFDVFEDTTPVLSIDGYTLTKYNPNAQINLYNGTALSPTADVGVHLKGGSGNLRPIAEVYNVSSVTGQELIPPNLKTLNTLINGQITDLSENRFIFIHPNIVASIGKHDNDIADDEFRMPSGALSKVFKRGDSVTITGTSVKRGTTGPDSIPISLDGTYEVTDVYQSTLGFQNSDFTKGGLHGRVSIYNIMYLDDPSSINANWSLLIDSGINAGTINLETGDLSGDNSDYGYDDSNSTTLVNEDINLIVGESDTDIGFRIEKNIDKVICNYIAQSGLRGSSRDGGEFGVNVTIRTHVDLYDENEVYLQRITQDNVLEGSTDGRTKALTVEFDLDDVYPLVKVSSTRLTDTIIRNGNQVQDIVKWRDTYGLRKISNLKAYQDITTLCLKVEATPSALKVNERRLNMWVERALPIIQTSGTTEDIYPVPSTSGVTFPNKKFSNILIDMVNDPYIGRGNFEINLDKQNIYDTELEIRTYFGASVAATFNYTFDKSDMVFEEMVLAVARCCFCQAYREGEKIFLVFDKENLTKKLLFNHRNKLPKSEKRTIRFANDKEYDGVEFEYTDDDDGSRKKIRIPSNTTLFKPKKITSIGVLSKIHAYFHANREYNRIRFQNTTVQFTATQEAATLVENDLILIADNTRAVTIDGEIIDYNALTYTLSQPIKTKFETVSGVETELPIISTPATLFIQMPDQTVETASITSMSDNQVVVSTPPSLPPVTNSDKFARTTYQIVENSDTPIHEFQITKISTSDNWTFNITAITHTDRIYGNDLDLINGIVGLDGELT